jgi:hypothetical protein
VSHSSSDVEERLKHSFGVFVSEVPDQPSIPWLTFVSPTTTSSHQWRTLVGVAASVVLIALAMVIWASPSAGARYHGPNALRAAPVVVLHHDVSPLRFAEPDSTE